MEEGDASEASLVEEELQDFVAYVADNGGDFGDDSIAESGVVVVVQNGAKPLDKITPKERMNELTNYFYQLVQRIGYGGGSMDAMDGLEQCLNVWEQKMLKETEGIGLAPAIRTTGKPPQHSLKPGNQRARSNGVKFKKTYRCSLCKKTGHTAGPRCPEICLDCPSSTRKHKKGQCPQRKRERQTDKKGKRPQPMEDSSTTSKNLSHRGRGYFSSLLVTMILCCDLIPSRSVGRCFPTRFGIGSG